MNNNSERARMSLTGRSSRPESHAFSDWAKQHWYCPTRQFPAIACLNQALFCLFSWHKQHVSLTNNDLDAGPAKRAICRLNIPTRNLLR